MKVITIPAEEKMLNKLLKQVQQDGLILENTEGQRFMLLAMEGWIGFDVGEDEDFEYEVELTSQNKELMDFLGRRRTNGKRLSLEEVEKQLGLE
jgi:hypothetical protein